MESKPQKQVQTDVEKKEDLSTSDVQIEKSVLTEKELEYIISTEIVSPSACIQQEDKLPEYNPLDNPCGQYNG